MASNPRVLVVTGEYPPTLGGIGDYTCKLTDALVDVGVDPLLFVPVGSCAHSDKVPIAATYDRWSWATLAVLLEALVAANADWLHVQHQVSMYKSHLSAYALPRFLRWKRWPGRIAVTFHDVTPPLLFPRGVRFWWRLSRDLILADLARNADISIAADPSHVDTLAGCGANVRQIPIGSNIAASDADEETLAGVRRFHAVPAGSLLIGHFGTPIGLETLLRALEHVPHAVLLLIGKQQTLVKKSEIEKLTPNLLAEIENRSVGDRLRWTGHLSESEAATAIAACDIIVLPYEAGASLRHGGLMAAITQGKAVITSSPTRPLPGLAEDAEIVTFPRGDVEALVAAIIKLTDGPDFRKSLEQKAARAAKTVFSWAAIAEAHRDIYMDR